MNLRRPFCLIFALALILLGIGLSACGKEENSLDTSEGVPVTLGDVQYKVVFSRTLNPYDVEDREYLVGQPKPGPNNFYLGVFVQIINKSKSADATIPSGWVITDTQDNSYYPVQHSDSPYALTFDYSIGPEDQVPALDSTAQSGPIGGSMILFKMSEVATTNRPLSLTIPTKDGTAMVKLDA
jgi:hypothetical protein